MPKATWLDGYTGQSTDELIALPGVYRTDSPVLAFAEAFDQKAERIGPEGLSAEEQVVLAIETLEREVNNRPIADRRHPRRQRSGRHAPPPARESCRRARTAGRRWPGSGPTALEEAVATCVLFVVSRSQECCIGLMWRHPGSCSESLDVEAQGASGIGHDRIRGRQARCSHVLRDPEMQRI